MVRLAPLALAAAAALLAPLTAAQKLPLKTSSRWILDDDGARVKLRCINWAAHGETNTPEGLHKASVGAIADFVRDRGFNCVRLTYSIDHALDPGARLDDSFRAAAAASGLPEDTFTRLHAQVVEANPALGSDTTRQDVFAAVIEALWDRKVMTILDNHVSKASWCCNLDDGNGWWAEATGYNDLNSRYFKAQPWLDGLAAMAAWARDRPGVAGLSIRNELRPLPFVQDIVGPHDDWFRYVTAGARAVHDAFPAALVIVGGSLSATDLSFLRVRNLDTAAWAGKHVWEMHAYEFTVNFPRLFGSCDIVRGEYGLASGFVLEQGKPYTGPLFLSEFGVGMQGGPNHGGLSDKDNDYFDCLKGWLAGNDADWALWALQGSYYVREGKAEYDETWGLMNKDWTGLRNDQFLPLMAELFNVTQGP